MLERWLILELLDEVRSPMKPFIERFQGELLGSFLSGGSLSSGDDFPKRDGAVGEVGAETRAAIPARDGGGETLFVSDAASLQEAIEGSPRRALSRWMGACRRDVGQTQPSRRW